MGCTPSSSHQEEGDAVAQQKTRRRSSSRSKAEEKGHGDSLPWDEEEDEEEDAHQSNGASNATHLVAVPKFVVSSAEQKGRDGEEEQHEQTQNQQPVLRVNMLADPEGDDDTSPTATSPTSNNSPIRSPKNKQLAAADCSLRSDGEAFLGAPQIVRTEPTPLQNNLNNKEEAPLAPNVKKEDEEMPTRAQQRSTRSSQELASWALTEKDMERLYTSTDPGFSTPREEEEESDRLYTTTNSISIADSSGVTGVADSSVVSSQTTAVTPLEQCLVPVVGNPLAAPPLGPTTTNTSPRTLGPLGGGGRVLTRANSRSVTWGENTSSNNLTAEPSADHQPSLGSSLPSKKSCSGISTSEPDRAEWWKDFVDPQQAHDFQYETPELRAHFAPPSTNIVHSVNDWADTSASASPPA